MGWRRASDCLMCGQDRCLENRDEPGVGYCYRYNTMHRYGKPFIKKGAKPASKEDIHWTVFGKGEKVGFGEGKGEKAVFEKGCPPSPPQVEQIEFGFEE